jgi:hypothetical protein
VIAKACRAFSNVCLVIGKSDVEFGFQKNFNAAIKAWFVNDSLVSMDKSQLLKSHASH